MRRYRALACVLTALAVVTALALGTTGTAAAATTTGVSAAVPPSATVDGPAITATLTTPVAAADVGTATLVHLTLTGNGLTPDDIHVVDTTSSGSAAVVLSSARSGVLVGDVGPAGGFRLTDGATRTLTVTVTVPVGTGDLMLRVQLVRVGDGTDLGDPANATIRLLAAGPAVITTTYPPSLDLSGAASPYESVVRNPADGVACAPTYSVTVSGAGYFLIGDEVSLSLNGTPLHSTADPFDPFTTTATGRTVAAGATGRDQWSLRDEGLPPPFAGTALHIRTMARCAAATATATADVPVLSPEITLRFPGTIIRGTAAPLSVTISNRTHSTYRDLAVDLISCNLARRDADTCTLRSGEVSLQISTTAGAVDLRCRLDDGVQECLLPIPSGVAPGAHLSLHLLVTVATSARLTRLGVATALTSGPDLLALASRTARVTAPAQARVVPGGTAVRGVGSAGNISTPVLAQTGAPTLPWTVGAGLALLVLGLLLLLGGRRPAAAHD